VTGLNQLLENTSSKRHQSLPPSFALSLHNKERTPILPHQPQPASPTVTPNTEPETATHGPSGVVQQDYCLEGVIIPPQERSTTTVRSTLTEKDRSTKRNEECLHSIEDGRSIKRVGRWKVPVTQKASRIYQQGGPGWVEAYRAEYQQCVTTHERAKQRGLYAQRRALRPNTGTKLRQDARKRPANHPLGSFNRVITSFTPGEVIVIEDDEDGHKTTNISTQSGRSATPSCQQVKIDDKNSYNKISTIPTKDDTEFEPERVSDARVLEAIVAEALNPDVERRLLEPMVLRWGEPGFIERQRLTLQDNFFIFQVRWMRVRRLYCLQSVDLDPFHVCVEQTLHRAGSDIKYGDFMYLTKVWRRIENQLHRLLESDRDRNTVDEFSQSMEKLRWEVWTWASLHDRSLTSGLLRYR
jgi:hypothetical protein